MKGGRMGTISPVYSSLLQSDFNVFDVVFSQVSRSMQITNNPRLRVGDVDFYADTLL